MAAASQPDAEKNDAKPVSFFKLFRFADLFDVLLMICGSVTAALHGVSMPVYFHFLTGFLDIYGGQSPLTAGKIAQQALFMVYLALVVWAASWAEVFCWTLAGERQALKIRAKFLQAILMQDIEKFDTSLQTGKIIESISSDMLLIQNALGEKMGNAINFLSNFLAGIIFGFRMLWQMSLVTMAIVPVIAVAGGLQAYMVTTLSVQSQEAYAQAGIIAEQAIAQVRTVHSFVGEARTLQSYSAALIKAKRMAYKIGLFNGLGLGTTFMATYGAFSLLVWFGSVLYFRGVAKGGSIVITMFFIVYSAIALGQATLSLSAFGQARAAAGKLFPVIAAWSNANDKKPKGKQLKTVEGEIAFKSVNFAYPSRPDVPILQNFSFLIPKGQSVAIVGSSGSGKSTLIALIERFYEPSSGRILLDGHDVKKMELKWLRQKLGLVSQEPVLFATSIIDNILLGNENATPEEAQNAAKFAHVHSFVQKLPDGYSTQVGEKGVQLSGGQKQRIALARAVLKSPPLLLLDEATSALDSSSEKLIQEALDQFMTSRTTVVIAHRLSTIQNVDTIVVLEKGKLLETGTHAELMSKGESGGYCKLVKLQETNGLQGTASSGSIQRTNPNATPRRSMQSPYASHISTPRTSIHSPYPSPLLGTFRLSSASHIMSIDVDSHFADGAPETEDKPIKTASFWRLLKLNAPEWPYALLGVFGCMLTGVVTPFVALLLGSISTLYYSVDPHYVRKEVRLYAIYFALLSAACMVGYIIQEYFWGRVNENLTKRIRDMLLSAILRSEIAWFDQDENSTSKLTTRLSSDASTVRTVLGARVSLLVNTLTVLIVSVTISLVLSWKMTLVTLSVFPLSVLAGVAEKAFLKGYTGDIEAAQRRATTIASEAVISIRTVAAFCAEDKIISLFTEELNDTKKKSLWSAQVAGFTFGIAKFFQFGTYGLSLWYGLTLVRHDESVSRHVLDTFFVMLFGAMVVGEAIGIVPDLVKGGGALESIFAVLDRNTEIDPDDKEAEVLDRVSGNIELKKVQFSYPSRPDMAILNGVNLKVAAGTTMALVGPSGCGKSTIVALIERFYDPLSGKVLVDGVDIRTCNLRSLRRHVGLVQQEPALFATTIYDNILYGNAEATEAEVKAAARVANAHEFISGLPDGYKTFVGESGTQLSGGQKQRVAIARALLKNPTILLLDEATSALDTESEKVVQEALERLMNGRTVVAIAHRLSSIRNMDAIAVLQDGVVVEKGTHSELLSQKFGVYARLVALQQKQL